MASESIGSDNENPATQQKAEAVEQCHAEQCELDHEVLEQSAILPPDAVRFLVQGVRQPEHLTFAIKQAESELVDNPTILSDPDIRDAVLTDCIETAAIECQRNREKSADVENKRETVANLKAKISGNLSGPDKAGQLSQLIQAVKDSADFSKAEREATLKHLTQITAQLSQIRQVAATPGETTAINQIMAIAPLNLGAGSNFEVFGDVLAQVDGSEDLSESTKQNVHKLFEIPTVETGGDVKSVLDNGRGVDTSGHRLAVDEAHKIRIAPNNYVYEEPDGRRTYEINLPDGRNLKTHFPPGSSDQHTGDLGIVMGNLYAAEALGLAEPIFQRGWKITHGGTIDIHYDDIIKAKRLNEIFMGGTAGHDNRLMNASDINRLKHDYQAFSRQGDLATGDNDPQRQREDFQELGIIMPDGAINWNQLERAALYLQTKTSQGGIPDFEDLKRALNEHLD